MERDRSSRRHGDRNHRHGERDRDRDHRHGERDRDRDNRRDRDRHRDRSDGRNEKPRRRHHRGGEESGDNEDRHRRRPRSPEASSSPSAPEPRRERSSSRARDSVDREPSEERRRSSRKRKDYESDEEEASRAGKRERRRFEDRRAEDSVDSNGRFGDERKRREGSEKPDRSKERDACMGLGHEQEGRKMEFSRVNGDVKNGLAANAGIQEPLNAASPVVVSPSDSNSIPTKVSSYITTNETEGVSIRSDEVPGKSSTDGTATIAGRSGNLSLDALAKAKKALQLKKELSEKLKKIPVLNKLGSMSSDNSAPSKKEDTKSPMSVAGMQPASGSVIASAMPAQAMSNLTTGVTSTMPATASGIGVIPGLNSIPNLDAVKRAQELAAKMGFRQDPEFAPLINLFPGSITEVTAPQRPPKAPVLRLDHLGREIDEHGNVISTTKPTNLNTLKVNINKQKKEAFQIIRPDLDAVADSTPHFDERMGINKTKLLRPRRPGFQFVEEGRLSKQAELQRIKNQFGEAQAKELKVKQAQLAKAKTELDINPNLIEVQTTVRAPKLKQKEEIPDIEWWDKKYLHSGTYEDITQEKLNMDRITFYVEHPEPIEPPAEPAPPPPQPLKLTKKEQKKLRTQRRLAKEKDRQEMIRQGLLEPPKPKIKMSNLMRVLGSEATQDPTRLEMEVRTAAAEREQAHVDRNMARKLTPAERREKKERKLFDDPNTLETIVSVYRINDLSHPQTRFKVDVNAQQNRLTGCAVISDGISVVVVEGGKKSIKRYNKLMLNRIDWAAAVADEDDADEGPDKPANGCALVWQGSVVKPNFSKFLVHQCRSEAAARKVFSDAGVPHYWDLAVNFSEDL